jgi:magnesium-transporting ATPase (P-type)
VALAFEPGEGDELNRKPRSPNEPIFDRIMLERVFISSLVMGGVSFYVYWDALNQGASLFDARNLILLLMVLFENIMVGNCRSETKSALFMSPFKNLFLLFGTLAAQGIHILAMHVPFLADILDVQPVSFDTWMRLFLMSLSVFVVMELHKLFKRVFASKE